MKKFEFRLQKVMDFREALESLAKDAYLDARAKRLEAEAMIGNIESRRAKLLTESVSTVDERLALEAFMLRLEDEERSQRAVISVLRDEEAHLMGEWHRAKQNYEALVKLRTKAEATHDLEASREEQNELDEWAVTRRAA